MIVINEWKNFRIMEFLQDPQHMPFLCLIFPRKKKYNIKPENFQNAMATNNCNVSLPLFNGMQEKEQDFVINNIKMH